MSFTGKHNLANGEENRDGENANLSMNFGLEGNAATPYMDALRLRQIKNFIATLFLSQGVPMLLAGDEMRRTQQGNNNAYCQDNEISWVDWSFLEKNRDLFRFTTEMIRFRKRHPSLRRKNFFTGQRGENVSDPDISWHGWNVGEPRWDEESHTVAMMINGEYANGHRDADIYIIFNASMVSRYYAIPESFSGMNWLLVADTSLPSPEDISLSGREAEMTQNRYYVKKLSTVVLITKPCHSAPSS